MEPERVATRLFADLLADFAFVCVERVAAAALPGLDRPGWRAAVRLGGVLKGRVLIAMPETFAIELAANAIGSGAPGGEPAADFVKELASLLGGHLAAAIPGVRPSPPVVSRLGAKAWERLRSGALAFAAAERGVLLRVETGP